MTDTQPKVWFAGLFPDALRVVSRDECDCACPDGTLTVEPFNSAYETPLRHAVLHRQTIDSTHTLMFNPLSDQGVAVLNREAFTLWSDFAQPMPISALPVHQQDSVRLMARCGLLEPLDRMPPVRPTPPKTLSAWLHVTNQCNLRCDYCYVHKTDDGMDEATGYAAIDALIRVAQKYRFHMLKVKYAGGEASLNVKLLTALHDYARSAAHDAGITLDGVMLSNGVALSDTAIERIKASGIRVMISLDGIGEVHDRQRRFVNGRGSFAYVERTLNRLRDHDVKPFISITVSDRTAADLPHVIDFVLDRELPFNLNFFRDNECASAHSDLMLNDDRMIEGVSAALKRIEARLPDASLIGSLVDRAQFHQPHQKTCGVGESYMVIHHQGKVAKCHMEIEQSVSDIYADDPLMDIRQDKYGVQNLPVEEKEGCRNCEWRYWCAGGCPLVTFKATGRWDVKSPYCHIYKAIYPQVLRLEALRLLKLAGASIAQ